MFGLNLLIFLTIFLFSFSEKDSLYEGDQTSTSFFFNFFFINAVTLSLPPKKKILDLYL